MNDFEFRNLEELYNRIKPALYSKVREFKRSGISYIKEVDIWNYLSINIWQKSDSLCLSDMVSSIMDLNEKDIKEYVLDILRKNNREIIKEEGELL